MPTKRASTQSVDELERHLGELAMQFRGTRVECEREKVTREYARTVEQLIKSREWTEVPGPEDQLPSRCMPPAFYNYWTRQFNRQTRK